MIEKKIFEISFTGSRALGIIKRGRKVTKELVLSTPTVNCADLRRLLSFKIFEGMKCACVW